MVRLNFKNQGCKMGVLAKHTNFSGLREKYNMGGLKLGSAACNSNNKITARRMCSRSSRDSYLQVR